MKCLVTEIDDEIIIPFLNIRAKNGTGLITDQIEWQKTIVLFPAIEETILSHFQGKCERVKILE